MLNWVVQILMTNNQILAKKIISYRWYHRHGINNSKPLSRINLCTFRYRTHCLSPFWTCCRPMGPLEWFPCVVTTAVLDGCATEPSIFNEVLTFVAQWVINYSLSGARSCAFAHLAPLSAPSAPNLRCRSTVTLAQRCYAQHLLSGALAPLHYLTLAPLPPRHSRNRLDTALFALPPPPSITSPSSAGAYCLFFLAQACPKFFLFPAFKTPLHISNVSQIVP